MNWRARIERAMPSPTGDWTRDAEVLDELAAHAADRHDELVRAGHADADAVAIVLREVADAARRQAARPAAWQEAAPVDRPRLFASAGQDLRYALRMLRRAPAFAAASIATLALAIGAVTAIFTVVEAVLLRPLPYPNADRLALIWESSPQGANRNVVSSGSYLDWRARNSVFEEIGAFSDSFDSALTSPGEPRRVQAISMTPAALAALAVRPVAGRMLRDEDTIANAARVALLGYRTWRDDFGADATVIGRQLTLSGRTYEVVGVLPEATVIPEPDVDVVLPLGFGPAAANERTAHNYMVVGRLKPGVSIDAANVAMRQLVAAMTAEHPKELTGWSALVAPLHGDVVRTVRPLLTLVFAVVVVVLVIACANLANVQLARASSRRAEMAVRAAIGAGRRRLVSQLLHESLVIVTIGGAIGVGLAWLLMRALVAAAPADIPFLDSVAINGRVLGVAALTTAASALLVGLLPALQISRADLQPLLRAGRSAGDARQARSRLALVTVQVALAAVLLVAAALVVRSMQKLPCWLALIGLLVLAFAT
jgi:putative ABC transport system permease protein